MNVVDEIQKWQALSFVFQNRFDCSFLCVVYCGQPYSLKIAFVLDVIGQSLSDRNVLKLMPINTSEAKLSIAYLGLLGYYGPIIILFVHFNIWLLIFYNAVRSYIRGFSIRIMALISSELISINL